MAALEILEIRGRIGRSEIGRIEVGMVVPISPEGAGVGRLRQPTNWQVPWVQVEDEQQSIGRHHARIAMEADTWWLTHSGTSNPTLLNGHPVNREVLRHGDIIEVPGLRLRFRAE
jgi:predicted component of type VI protein secretion system